MESNMLIAVLEYPEDDQAQVFFIDVSKLDLTNVVQRHYFDNIMEAHNHANKAAGTSYDASVSYGEDIFEAAVVNPPCQVEDSVTLYIE